MRSQFLTIKLKAVVVANTSVNSSEHVHMTHAPESQQRGKVTQYLVTTVTPGHSTRGGGFINNPKA